MAVASTIDATAISLSLCTYLIVPGDGSDGSFGASGMLAGGEMAGARPYTAVYGDIPPTLMRQLLAKVVSLHTCEKVDGCLPLLTGLSFC